VPDPRYRGFSFADLESLCRTFAYTLESAADRSEEGSARVSDTNRMERSRMMHRSYGARGRTEDDYPRCAMKNLGTFPGDAPC
jgi:hypothetical protein